LVENKNSDYLRFRMYYTQNGVLMPSILNRGIRDSLTRVTNLLSTRPDDEIVAWVVPEDMFGNQGKPSDTILAYALSYSKAPLLNDLYATSVVDGVRLSWPEAPKKPYVKGIKLQRYNSNNI